MKKIVAVVSVIAGLLASSASAANHYIRAGATGANNGNSWADAWTSLPSTYVRGDTYYVAGGSYSGRTFSTAASGTSYITIKKATDGDHGTDTGWSSSYGTAQAVFSGELAFTTSYWIVDGVSRTGWKTGYGFKVNHDGNGCEMGIGSAVNNITIQYVEFQGHGPDGAPYPNNTTFYAVYGGSNLKFSYIYSHDIGCKFWQMAGVSDALIEYCWLEKNESTPEQHAEGIYHTGATRMIVRNSVWVDVVGTGVIVFAGSDCEVYGNLIYWTGAGDIGNGAITSWSAYSVNNAKIYNNTIIVPTSGGYSYGISFPGSASGNVARNNLFYGLNARDVVNWAGVGDHDYSWFYSVGSQSEAHSQAGTGNPFVNSAAYDFRLKAHTTPGLALGSPYSISMEGNRTTWDRGAYEFGSGGSGSLTVSAGSALTVMLPNSATLNGSYANPLGGIVTLGWSVVSGPGTVSFSSPASATTTASFSAAGTYVLRLTATVAAVSASDDVTVTVTQPDTTPPTVSVTLPAANAVVSNSVTLAANATDNAGGAGVTNVTFLVDGTVVGSDSSAPYTASWNSLTMPNGQHSIQARAKDGAGNQTTSAFISVTVQNPVAPAGTVRIEAENGSISGDFTVSNGAVSQTTDTTVTTGGRAVYSFTVTNAGDYQIDAVVNAPDLAENSFFVNIDAEPVDPTMVWDILPLTTGFETRTISWRGNGSAEVQAPNKVFTLSAGQHSLIIIGREANTSLDRLEIKKIVQPLAPPSNIRVVVTP